MLAGIRDILMITTKHDHNHFLRTLGDGSEYGVNISYKIQNNPDGLAQAFIIGEDFIGDDNVCLILGDNIFWGQGFTDILQKTISQNQGATIFGYQVNDPERYGVVEFSSEQKVVSVEEKPKKPKSNYAITGLYFYDNNVVEMAKKVKPSNRGELEITSLNQMYLDQGNLNVELLGRGFVWLDTGTFESLLEAALFAETIEKRQGYKIACLEEIAWRNSWLSDDQLLKLANSHMNNNYGKYLKSLIQ
jgi:glucose-1-phosphate thymidylyltransferase